MRDFITSLVGRFPTDSCNFFNDDIELKDLNKFKFYSQTFGWINLFCVYMLIRIVLDFIIWKWINKDNMGLFCNVFKICLQRYEYSENAIAKVKCVLSRFMLFWASSENLFWIGVLLVWKRLKSKQYLSMCCQIFENITICFLTIQFEGLLNILCTDITCFCFMGCPLLQKINHSLIFNAFTLLIIVLLEY